MRGTKCSTGPREAPGPVPLAVELAPAARHEVEGIGNDGDASAGRFRKLPALDRVDHALLDVDVAHGRALHDGAENLAQRRDDELDREPAFEPGLAHQLLVVAVLHLVHVQVNHAPDDLLVERAAGGDDARGYGGNPVRGTAVEATDAWAMPVAIAPKSVVVAYADGRQVRAAAARSAARNSPTTHAPAARELIADQIAEDVLLRVAHRQIMSEDVRELRGLGRAKHAKNAPVENVRSGLGLAEVHVLAVSFDGIRAQRPLRFRVAHLSRFADVGFACLTRTLIWAIGKNFRGRFSAWAWRVGSTGRGGALDSAVSNLRGARTIF